jgi:hypothetical protein
MENLDNIEGVGMDRVETPTPKKAKAKKASKPTLDEKVISMYPQFNENQIASMLQIHKHEVIAILEK